MDIVAKLDYVALNTLFNDKFYSINLRKFINTFINEIMKNEYRNEYLRYLFTSAVKIGDRIFSVGLLNDKKMFIIKYTREGEEDELRHEYDVALQINKLSENCVNFPFTYAIFESTKPIIEGERIYMWPCEYDAPVKHIIQTYIPHHSSLYDYYMNEEYTLPEIMSILLQIILALEYAYTNIKFIHGDFNPSNILVSKVDIDDWIEYPNYYVQTYGVLATIIDFDYSHTNKHKAFNIGHWMPTNDNLTSVDDLAILLKFLLANSHDHKFHDFLVKYMNELDIMTDSDDINRPTKTTKTPKQSVKLFIGNLEDNTIVYDLYRKKKYAPADNIISAIDNKLGLNDILLNLSEINNPDHPELRYIVGEALFKDNVPIFDHLDKMIHMRHKNLIGRLEELNINNKEYCKVLLDILDNILYMNDNIEMLYELVPDNPVLLSIDDFIYNYINNLVDKKWVEAKRSKCRKEVFDILLFFKKIYITS